MKKIIYAGSFRFPNLDAGAHRVLNNAKLFRNLGYDVEIISFGGIERDEDLKVSDGCYYYEGFKYTVSKELDNMQTNPLKKIINSIFRGKQTIKTLKNNLDNIQYIILYNPSFYFTTKILKLTKGIDIKIISDLNEWFDANEIPGGKLAPFYWLSECNMNFVQKKVPNKILISSYLNKFYNSSNNILLPPLTDTNDDKWKVSNDNYTSNEKLKLIYAGTPGKKDNLELILICIINLLKKEKNIQFTILGVNIDDIQHYSCVNDIQLYLPHIHFLGRVPHSDVPKYYQKADFSILIRENNRKNNAGFPTKLAESFTAGCPVIVNKTSDIKNYVKNYESGLIIEDCTIDSIENVLEIALSINNTKLQEMKKMTLKKSIEYFDYNSYKDAVKKFLINCC